MATYNPYLYSNPYQSGAMPQWNVPQPQLSTMPSQPEPLKWVEGKVGAQAYQMPPGWPANSPIALWDTTEPVIWLKSVNQMGMPNPLQKLTYKMEEQPNTMLPAGQSGNAQPDMSQYVTKSDLEQLRQEIRGAMNSGNNQNGSNYGGQNGNRGGNK